MKQRIIIAMMDGFGLEYFQKSSLPNIKQMAEQGFFKEVKGIFPSVTNVNNISIACGAWPEEHGIVANSYYDKDSHSALYMNSSDMVRCDSVFARAKKKGLKSALLTSKRKTKELLGKDADIAIAAEDPTPEQLEQFGPAQDIYSREINYWLWEAAEKILKEQPEIDILYVHTTDYPMHAWAPEQDESREHLKRLDEIMGSIRDNHSDVAFLMTADHGMNSKKHCWDLEKVCSASKEPVQFVLSPERDYYVKHHRNFTGCAWLWLNPGQSFDRVKEIICKLKGVEQIYTREEAVKFFHLDGRYIGDMVILGDKDTMFGEMEQEYEDLSSDYRAHGSLYEMDLPLIIYNYKEDLPSEDFFRNNKDLTAFLFR